MSPSEFKLVRNFFRDADAEVPRVVALMYQNFFVLAPETAPMFKENMETHHQRFTQMLRQTIELLRTCHLWPVLALSGEAALPGLENLGCLHVRAGVTPEHYAKMKLALTQALETVFPDKFTQDVRIPLSKMYDVLAHSMTSAKLGGHQEEAVLERLFNREIQAEPERGEPLEDFAAA